MNLMTHFVASPKGISELQDSPRKNKGKESNEERRKCDGLYEIFPIKIKCKVQLSAEEKNGLYLLTGFLPHLSAKIVVIKTDLQKEQIKPVTQ